MITNKTVTLWHRTYDKESRMDVYVQIYCGEASVQEDVKVSVEDGGLKAANTVKIRIPTDSFLSIKNGDQVVLFESNEEKPPKDAYTVVGVADNRKGSRRMHHWKVVCA